MEKNYLVISRHDFGCSRAERQSNVRIRPNGVRMDKTTRSAPTLITTEETVLCTNILATTPRLTPTGKISHAKTRVYTQRYRKDWEQMPDFKGTCIHSSVYFLDRFRYVRDGSIVLKHRLDFLIYLGRFTGFADVPISSRNISDRLSVLLYRSNIN